MEKSGQETLAGRPRLELSDIFRKFRPWLKPIPKTEAKVVSDIVNCRTAALGGHRLECNACGHEEFSYNSCRNRHCPKCQFLSQAKWVEARKAELLPVQYFHMVFTVPHELNGVIWANKKIGFDILFRAMSATLKEVAETQLKAKIGFTAVLHTWSQTLGRHAHIHAIVPGGGLSFDGKKWISADQGYFLPIKILSIVFRAKFLELLEDAYPELKFSDEVADLSNQNKFKNLLIQAARHDWVVYAKAPFAGPSQVLEYLGNYTHRIAISNYRIEEVTDSHVTFRYKDRADGNKTKSLTLPAQEFIQRFLSHALPGKFVRLRHFGFLGSKGKEKNLETARIHLNARKIEKAKDQNWKDLLKRLTGADISQCPCCKQGSLIETATLLPHGNLRKRKLDSS